jgi:alkaline phosphatase D
MFPDERERLIALVDATDASGVVLISGDTHRGQLLRRDRNVPYALWEVNSSGLTRNNHHAPIDPLRIGSAYMEDNFGLIEIDWRADDPTVRLEIRDVHGDIVLEEDTTLARLRRNDAPRMAGARPHV